MSDLISRRTALVGGIGSAGLLTLAACAGSSGSGDSNGDAGGSGAGRADPTSPTPAAGSGPSSSAAGAAGGSTAGLAQLSSIAVGEAVSANFDGKPVLVSRPTETTAVCFSAICTHQGCTVAPAGKRLQCPCHGSVYNATTGAVISGPAPRALDKIAVTVEGGEVVPAG